MGTMHATVSGLRMSASSDVPVLRMAQHLRGAGIISTLHNRPRMTATKLRVHALHAPRSKKKDKDEMVKTDEGVTKSDQQKQALRQRMGLNFPATIGLGGSGLPRGLLSHPLFRDVENAMEHMDELVNMGIGGKLTPTNVLQELTMPSMPMDIVETPTAFEVAVNLPGLSKRDVHIEVKEINTPSAMVVLIISNSVSTPQAVEDEIVDDESIWHRAERHVYDSEFRRVVHLPSAVSPDQVKARMEMGVLYVSIGKKEVVEEISAGRVIEIE